MTATIDGLTRERLLEFANASTGDDRETLLELAGKWKHNWIPLDAIAAAIKAKRMKGDGVRRSSADTGAVRAVGKTRFDPKGAAAHSALTSGARGKARPPARAAVTQAKAEARRVSQHASNLYDRHIGSRPEASVSPEHLREVARAHEAADAAHHRAGNPSEAEWHRGEANRLHGHASRPAPMIPGARTDAAKAINAHAAGHDARHAQIAKEIKVRKLTEGGNVSFLAEHSNGVNTVSARIPQQRGRTDHEHRLAAREALAKGIRRDHPDRAPAGGPHTTEEMGVREKPVGENAPSVRGSTQADRDKALRAQREAQTAAAISSLAGRDMADLRRLAESKAVKPKVRAAALAELRKRETPEQTAQRIGMEFVKPTVKGHTVIGEGTVEAQAPRGNVNAATNALREAGIGWSEKSVPASDLRPGDVTGTGDETVTRVENLPDGHVRVHWRDNFGAVGHYDHKPGEKAQLWPPGKAEAAAEPAAPVKKPRKPSALHQEYRTRREEQDRRFEAHTGGGVAAGDTHTQEYKDYFGVGDHSTTPQEQRLTFKSFLQERRQGAEYERRQQQAYDSGAQLGAKHGEHEGDTSGHEAEYQHAAAGHDEEMFGQGYSDGVIAGAARADKRQKDNARKMAELEYGRARDAAHATTAAAVTESGHRAAVHAHVAAGRASLAAGRRQEAQQHIAKAEEHKGHADRLAAELAQAKARLSARDASPLAGEARRFGEAANSGQRANIGQAQAEARKAAQGPPRQGEMFGGHGEHQADIFDQPEATPPAVAGIRVEHSGDGTLVHGTTRGDTETTSALKAQGFKWSRNLNAWYLPRTWNESTRDTRVRGLQARLGDKITVQRGDLAKSTGGAEERQQRIDRANELAQAHTERAGKLDAEAQRRFDAADRATAGIPFGQPILVGHHSQRRHERALEKSHSNMGAGVQAHQEAQQARERAGAAAARARLEENPKFLARRLDRNQAEHRKVLRTLERANPADEHTQRLHAIRQDLEGKINADQAAMRAHGGGQHSKATITAGDVVVHRGDPRMVTRTNAKTVTVPHWEPRLADAGYTDTIPYSQIDRHHRLEDAKPETLRKYLDAPNIPAAVKSRIRAILRDRGES